MAFSTDQGDRVLLADNERLDKPDYNAAVDLANGILGRALGLLMGPIGANGLSGCASSLSTSWDAGTNVLSLSGALLFQSGALTSPSGKTGGRIINYDPTTATQIAAGTGVNLAGYQPGSLTCIIWARRSTAAGSLDTRKRWVPGASAESSFGPNTRTAEIVQFEVTPATFNGTGQVTAYTAPSSVADFFPILKIQAWPAGVPTVELISVWDGTADLSLIGDIPTRMDTAGNGSGLGYLLWYVRYLLSYIYDDTGASNWTAQGGGTARGLLQLDTDLAALQTDIDVSTETVIVGSAIYQDDTGVSGDYRRVDFPGGSFLVALPDCFPLSVTPAGVGDFLITLDAARVAQYSADGYAIRFAQASTADHLRCFGYAASASTVQVNTYAIVGGAATDPTYFSVFATGVK